MAYIGAMYVSKLGIAIYSLWSLSTVPIVRTKRGLRGIDTMNLRVYQFSSIVAGKCTPSTPTDQILYNLKGISCYMGNI